MTSPNALWQVNGILDATFPVNDRGLAYGDGLFETMRWQPRGCPFWHYHRARLLAGCARLNIPFNADVLDAEYAHFLQQINDKNPHLTSAVIKLIVTRGQGGRGYMPPETSIPNSLWQLLPTPVAGDEASLGVALELSSVKLSLQPLLAGLKHLNRLEYVLAAQRASTGLQPLLMDASGLILETLSHNIFLFDGARLLTPCLNNAGVKGVLRDYLTDTLTTTTGLPLLEAELSLQHLYDAEEVFIGNSVRGLWPVTSFKSTQLHKTWPVSPLCSVLQQHLDAYLKRFQ